MYILCMNAEQLELLVERFESLAHKWEMETMNISSPHQKMRQKEMREIVKMGLAAVPLILKRIEDKGGFWFLALFEITGQNPVPTSAAGNLKKVNDAWIRWGRKYGKKTTA